MEPNQPVQLTSSSTPILSKLLLFIIIIFGFISAFAGGYIMHGLFRQEQPITTTHSVKSTIPSPTPINDTKLPPAEDSDTTKFILGKGYFDDTIIAITKSEPHQAIAISARRIEQDNGFIQRTGISFFDGDSWSREQATDTTPDSKIITNKFIRAWVTDIDKSRVLKENMHATLVSKAHTIQLSVNNLTNEIGMRSLPGYTKFMSNKSGLMTIDDKQFDAYILYTRIYSLNAKDIQFYDQPLGLQTFWIAFWDDQGNFYHIDTTTVSKPTDVYKTHQIAVEESANEGVFKSFSVQATTDTATPPNVFGITTNLPNRAVLTLNRLNALNKAPNNSYTWIMGTIQGQVRTTDNQEVKGFGLVEYIKD